MPLSAGDKLGSYELLAPLGAGGMGEVWKARDTRLGRLVAIKLLKGNHSRFQQEARAVAALNHPHICQIYDVGPDYLVLEYVEGALLKGPLPAEEAVRLAMQIAGALEEAHGRNILHRDLKPANILVTPKGTVKLLDFGLATFLSAPDSDATRTLEGTVMGTAAYMAPEQAGGKAVDARSDIFSFGAVLYEMLAGARAFGAPSVAEVLSAILRDEPPPLEAPAALQRIVRKCLAKAPAARFQSVTELRTALEQVFGTSAGELPSIAVLPFANMSAGKDEDYFSDGLAEEIINALAQVPGLKVTARTSAFAFRGKEVDVRKIADTLGVRTILEGSVRRAGNRIRVTAQLINAADGYHLWSQRYDREMADVFAIQDEIASAIAEALQVKLAPKPTGAERHKPKLPAYEAYLRGRHHQFKATPGSWEKARECYQQAIALDPQFALAYGDLAGLFNHAVAVGIRPPQENVPAMRTYATRALELDPALPQAHTHLATAAGLFDNDWNEAECRFKLAMAHPAVPPDCRFLYMAYLVARRRPLEAVEEVRRAVEQDPLSRLYRMYLALSLWTAGCDEEAVREGNRVLDLDENYPGSYFFFALYHAHRGAFREALPFAEKSYLLSAHLPHAASIFAGVLLRNGDAAGAEKTLGKLAPPTVFGVPRAFAYFYLIAGEIDKAADWCERAVEQSDGTLAFSTALPVWNPLTASTRWPALARRMRLPENV